MYMQWFRLLVILCLASSTLLLTSCSEVKEGADEFADEVTGKKKIEKKIALEKKIKGITDKANKQQSDALKQLTE